MANHMGNALTTGCEEDSICAVKTEVYFIVYCFLSSSVQASVVQVSVDRSARGLVDIKNLSVNGYDNTSMDVWSRLSFHRLVSLLFSTTSSPIISHFSSISRYSTASTLNAAYIIGGQYTNDIIAEFKDNKWRQLGNLVKGKGFSHANYFECRSMNSLQKSFNRTRTTCIHII